ncbi:MAG: hypothetical protein LBD59_05865 [Prevotellaceae bacterium]|nr:hypothetical protein [Prevotellaceae bacterium]
MFRKSGKNQVFNIAISDEATRPVRDGMLVENANLDLATTVRRDGKWNLLI